MLAFLFKGSLAVKDKDIEPFSAAFKNQLRHGLIAFHRADVSHFSSGIEVSDNEIRTSGPKEALISQIGAEPENSALLSPTLE
jgi:hypothetical protein